MSEDGWVECCGNIFLEAVLAVLIGALIKWAEENPFWAKVIEIAILGTLIVYLAYNIIKKAALKKEMKTRQDVTNAIFSGYFLGLCTWLLVILLGFGEHLFIVLGLSVFIGVPIVGLIYLKSRNWIERRKEKTRKAKAWELKDQLRELKEQLESGYITQEEYEQKKRKLLEKSKT